MKRNIITPRDHIKLVAALEDREQTLPDIAARFNLTLDNVRRLAFANKISIVGRTPRKPKAPPA